MWKSFDFLGKRAAPTMSMSINKRSGGGGHLKNQYSVGSNQGEMFESIE